MIQRIQSIFILVAMALVASLIFWPIDMYSSAKGLIELRWDGVWDVTPGCAEPLVRGLIPVAVIVVAALALNLAGLFLFKRRKLQMRLVGVAAGVEICLAVVAVYLGVNIAAGMEMEWHFSARWLLPSLAAVMDILAYRRISDDEALVRSLDRLR